MRRTTDQFCLDQQRRIASVNGVRISLQDKAWRVLALLVSRAPEVVSRSEIIDEVWRGNYLTGDKGLNQALWAIRSALGDDARHLRFIQTRPRIGYRCLAEPNRTKPQMWRRPVFQAIAAGLATLALVLPATPTSDMKLFTLPVQCDPSDQADVQAYRVDRNLFVDFDEGCRLIVKPSGDKQFGEPLVSLDGQFIAFTVTEEQSCRLLTIGLQNGESKDFGECPA